jgi:hypothetical protein
MFVGGVTVLPNPSKRNSSTTSHFALSRCGRSCSTTDPSKRNSSTTSHFALSRCGRSCSTTDASKRNSSTTSHFALSRCGRSCSTTNPSKRNSSATSHFAINRCRLICSITTHCGIGLCQLHGRVAQKQAPWSIQLKWGRVCFRWVRFRALSSPGWLVYRLLWPALSAFLSKVWRGSIHRQHS